jgi:O-antigen/teichoic acid export membrane protein
MPAELSLYSLIFVDRIVIVRYVGPAEVGLYALAFKFSQAIQVIVRGFQLAWPPLAYSITDDEEAKRVYAVVLTAFVALSAFIVTGMWLEARWIVRILAASEFFRAYEAIGLLALGAALYGIYLALLVVLGRTGRTEFNFPATLAALVVNVGLNLWLVPIHGMVGAGVALVISYGVALILMLVFTQRLFPVPWQWARLAAIVGFSTVVVVAGELLLPTEGAVGLLSRAALWLALLPLLWFGGAVSAAERKTVRELARPDELRRRLAELRARAADSQPEPGGETIESELRDEDRRSF